MKPHEDHLEGFGGQRSFQKLFYETVGHILTLAEYVVRPQVTEN